jgi:cytochrome oxidase Cu insertion factor (SCO1/SenC/PrrC family)
MSSLTRSIGLTAAAILLITTAAWSQEKAKPAPAAQTWLKVGEQAPKIALKDQDGKERSLDELLKKGKVALVFFRSADW